MDALQELFDRLLSSEAWEDLPSLPAWREAMDPVAWIMVGAAWLAALAGLFLHLRTRRAASYQADLETMPASLLERLKANPAYLAPAAILQRIGADKALELLEYGDSVEASAWVSQWTPVREELLRLLSAQHAFAPVNAMIAYYRCADRSEPASLRIRRAALIHKLGQRRYVAPGPDNAPAQLLVFTDGDEPAGELGFPGRIHWLKPEHRPQTTDGPMVELDPINFYSLEKASLQVRIYRSLLVGAGFRLFFTRIGDDWIVTREELEWAR